MLFTQYLLLFKNENSRGEASAGQKHVERDDHHLQMKLCSVLGAVSFHFGVMISSDDVPYNVWPSSGYKCRGASEWRRWHMARALHGALDWFTVTQALLTDLLESSCVL